MDIIKKTIREFLIEELRDNGFHEAVRDDESLIDAGIMDSLSILKTISFLDEKFGIFLTEDELAPKNFESIIAIHNIVKKKPGQNI